MNLGVYIMAGIGGTCLLGILGLTLVYCYLAYQGVKGTGVWLPRRLSQARTKRSLRVVRGGKN